VIQACGVELDKLHVCDTASGTPCHRDAVTGGHVRVGRIEVYLAGTAGGDHRAACADREHSTIRDVEDVCTQAAFGRMPHLVAKNQIDTNMVFHHVDVRVLAHLFGQCCLHRRAGRICRVDDSPVRMPAFAGQVIAERGFVFTRKRYASIDQPFDGLLAMLDDESRRDRITETCARSERVLNMGFDAVGRIKHGSDAALSPGACAVGQGSFGHQGDTQRVCKP